MGSDRGNLAPKSGVKKVFAGIFALAAALALAGCANANRREVTLTVVNEWPGTITEVGLSGFGQFRWDDLSIATSQTKTFSFAPGSQRIHANVFVYAYGLRDDRREVTSQFTRGSGVTVTLNADGSISSTWRN